MTGDLASWLTAVWDEEERLAREAAEEGTGVFRPHWSPVNIPFEGISFYSDGETGGYEDAVTRHIGLHDPASELARIAAYKGILALHMPFRLDTDRVTGCDTCSYRNDEEELQVVWPCPTLRLLASPYADRERFRSEWLVERQGVEG